LVGAVEVQIVTTDRAVRSEIIRAEEPIAADLPGPGHRGDLHQFLSRKRWK
jgi:hypothetical protein